MKNNHKIIESSLTQVVLLYQEKNPFIIIIILKMVIEMVIEMLLNDDI